nr:uncharacterized protein LOC112701274 isoform X2 [Arachis hypogaea]
MSEDVIPVFHHGGSFVRDNKGVLVYVNGEVKKFFPMDIDLICFFVLKKLFLDLGYHDYKAMFWYDPTATDLESGLHPVHGDKEIRDLQKNKMLNEDTDEFYIYFDHPIMEDIEFIDDDGVSVEKVEVQEASAEDDGVDNDADIESLDSDDGYESTEDVLYKPPPSGYSFSDSSSEEELVGAGKKGKNNGKKKSKVSKPVNGPVGKGNGKPKRAAIGREEVAGASVQRKSHGGPGRPNKSDYGPAEKDKVVNGPSSGNKNKATAASVKEGPSKSKKPATFDEELGVELLPESDIEFEYESEQFLTSNDSSDDGGDRFDWPQFNPSAEFGEVQFQLNMEFKSLEQFKQALKDFTISEGRRIFYVKNDKRRVRAACIHGGFMLGKEVQKAKAKARKAVKKKAKLQAAKEANESEKAKGVMETNEAHPEGEKNNEGHITNEVEAQANAAENAKCGNEGEKNGETDKHDCPWLIYCAKNSRSGGYQIKTYNPTHTCGREFGSNMADQHWVARKLEKRLLSQPRLTHAEAWDHMKVDYNVILNDKMLYRGLRMARKKYVGNEKAQHGKLRDYLNEIHRFRWMLPEGFLWGTIIVSCRTRHKQSFLCDCVCSS